MKFTQSGGTKSSLGSASVSTNNDGRHRRDAVLRVLTDLFVLDGDRQAPDERARQEELMIALASEAGMVMRQEVAERLAPLANPPARLISMLARDIIAVAAPILRHCEGLEDLKIADIVLTTSVKHARAAAERALPGIATAEAIIAIEDREAILTLIANQNVIFSKAALERLCRLARNDAVIANKLMARGAMPPIAAATLFWSADSTRREAIIARLEKEPSWPLDLSQMQPPMRVADARSRHAAHRGLLAVLKAGRRDDFRAIFGRAMGLKPQLEERIFADKGGETFAIACRAAGFAEQEFATLLLLYNREIGSSVQRVFALRGFFAAVSEDLAWRMITAWNASLPRKSAATATAGASPEQIRTALHNAEIVVAETAAQARPALPLRGAMYEPVGVRAERVSAVPPARPVHPASEHAATLPRGSGRTAGGGRR